MRKTGQQRARTPLKNEGDLDVRKSRHGKEKEDVLDERQSEEQAESKEASRE